LAIRLIMLVLLKGGYDGVGVEAEQEISYRLQDWVREIAGTLIIILALILIINAVSGRYKVIGSSMLPTLVDGEYVLASKMAYWIGEPQRGDIIVLRPPAGDVPYVKRIIGLPGERVAVRDGRVFINDVVLNEPYISGPAMYTGEWVVAENTYFVLGDNRNNSSDSHAFGVVPREHILAKAIMGYWPLKRMAFLQYPRYPELLAQGRDHE